MNTTPSTRATSLPGHGSRTTAVPPRWLRPSLLVDAGVSGVNGVAYVGGAAYLADLLGPPPAVVVGLGVFLLLWAAVLGAVATRTPLPVRVVRAVGYLNLTWVAGSVAAALGLLTLTGIGVGWCLLQAAAVLGFAAAQLVGTRR